MPRAYLALKAVPAVYLHPLKFPNGVRLVTGDEFPPSNLTGWQEVFSLRELREINEWHLALACDWDAENGVQVKTSPEHRLATARLALQVAAPIGSFLSICIREQDDSENPRLMTTRFEQFHGTPWSRMRGFNGMTSAEVESIVDGISSIVEQGNIRTVNPIRLFEHGLVSQEPYIRILLWTTAIDGILMAVTKDRFENRLCAFLGTDSHVFPTEDGVFIKRSTVVGDVASDLFELRSELAHGRPIGKRFWELREDLRDPLNASVYGGMPRYRMLLEEAALSLLSRVLRKIILENLVSDFSSTKKWKARLDGS